MDTQPRNDFIDYYEILTIKRTATNEEISRRRRDLIRMYHPDKYTQEAPEIQIAMQQRSAEINAACDFLLDETKRAQFDVLLAELDNLTDEDDEDASVPEAQYALLQGLILYNHFRGAKLLRNAGIITFESGKFALTYMDKNGIIRSTDSVYTRAQILDLVEHGEFVEKCIFAEGVAAPVGSHPLLGYTFVSADLIGQRLRWSCTETIWNKILETASNYSGDAPKPTSGKQEQADVALRDVVRADFERGGILSRALPGYEERPAQVQMARRVSDALVNGDHLVAEASTGTGKSIAYLIPIIRSGKVALISTANKALQEQLYYKDIPFIQQYVAPFEAALVKGMGNYLCLDRFAEEEAFQQLTGDLAFKAMVERMGDYDEWNGDLDLLQIPLRNELRGRLVAESDQCAWRNCPHFHDCYVREMRDRARNAQVIVVNHTLLLLDTAMEGFLLPERDVVVIDEAHHLEEEATRAFTVTITPGRVTSLLAQQRLRAHADPLVVQQALTAYQQAWDALARVSRPDAKGRQHLTQPLEEGLALATAIGDLATSLKRNQPITVEGKEEQLYEKLVKRTRSLAKDARLVFAVKSPDERVYYLEKVGGSRRREAQLAASAAPLSVADLLREKLFDRIPTIATSATLAVNNRFTFFRERVGLPASPEAVLPLTFDYRTHALLYVPRLRHEPAFGAASGPYLDEMASEMAALVEASEGRAFLLFSSFSALEGVLGRIERQLDDDGYTVLAQGRELSRMALLKAFRESPRAVLFGLKSFWEGVDVQGEALSLVVIDKLPFDPPDDPVHEARINQMKAAGVNWFGEYVLPQAILRLKQGIGRLLRTRDDRGVLAILDKRLYTKSYGGQVLAALPPARRVTAIEEVRAFFAADAEAEAEAESARDEVF